jgi:hypothetical protein
MAIGMTTAAKREAAAALGKRLNIAFGLGHIYETDGA